MNTSRGRVGTGCTALAIALTAVCGSVASAQRAVVPDRIGWREPHGGSDFAESLHNLSEQGKLDGNPQPATPAWGGRWGGRYVRPWYIKRYPQYGYDYNDYYDSYYRYPYGIDGRVVYGAQPGSRLSFPSQQANQASTPQQTQAQPPEPLTPVEQARLDVEAERYDEAITAYRAHLAEDEGDFEAAAELAVALLASGRHDDAVSMIRLAYASDPQLAVHPIAQRLAITDSGWRELVVQSVRHAHRRGTPAAWLTVAVLMQSEGRAEVALRMLDRARDLGLEDAIATPLAAVLR